MIYYNEFDPKAAAWLRVLIDQGHLPYGHVDTRSIEDVKASDLTEYTQCHFFAGIGGWPLALRMAGWPDDQRVWTGSCPCQPFSVANSRRKAIDHRDLFGVWASLIRELRPPAIFGEQVSSPLGLAWFDTVRTDLENEDYAVGGADLCAAGVGAPHIRQRLYWVALAGGERQQGERLHVREWGSYAYKPEAGRSGEAGDVGDARGPGSWRDPGALPTAQKGSSGGLRSEPHFPFPSGEARYVGNASSTGLQEQSRKHGAPSKASRAVPWETTVRTGGSAVWCTDGKFRPVEPGTFPLAHGVSGRVGLLRGYGNAIVPQVAQAFIESVMEIQA